MADMVEEAEDMAVAEAVMEVVVKAVGVKEGVALVEVSREVMVEVVS